MQDTKKVAQKRDKDVRKRVNPHFKSNSDLLILSILTLFNTCKSFIHSQGTDRLTFDKFMILLVIACFGRVGCSTFAIVNLLYVQRSNSIYNKVKYNVRSLYDVGLVSRVRGTGNSYIYIISIQAEKMIRKSLTPEELRSMALIVKDSIHSK